MLNILYSSLCTRIGDARATALNIRRIHYTNPPKVSVDEILKRFLADFFNKKSKNYDCTNSPFFSVAKLNYE